MSINIRSISSAFVFGVATAGLSAILTVATPSIAQAGVCGVSGTGLQGVFDDITVGGPSSIDVDTDCLVEGIDKHFSIEGSGGAISTIVIELAGFADDNKFGIYDATDSSKTVEFFDGSDTTGDQTVLSIKVDGSIYINLIDTGINFASNHLGFYLAREGEDAVTWYSDTTLNSDNFDHMKAYQGNGEDIQIADFASGAFGANEYILAFEDMVGGGDEDFTDFVAIIESLEPRELPPNNNPPNEVPEPGTLALFGLGLAGLGFVRRRKTA